MTSPRPRRLVQPVFVFACAATALAQGNPSPAPAPSTASAATAPKPAAADEPKPWRLNEVLGGPSWLKISGEQRTRYESLHDQFRFRNANATPPGRGFGADEDVLALRTSVLLQGKGDQFGGAFEFLDARQYGIDDTGFADATMVNTADVLQLYLDVELGELGAGKHKLRVGREAVDLGNRRLMARNAYRNTINAFTGASWLWADPTHSFRAFWTLPVDRRPGDFASVQDNEWELDDQDRDLQFFGAYYDHKLDDRTNLEFYVFGLDESGATTRRRELYTPGLRLNRARKKGEFQYELELTGQFGESKANTTASSPGLDHLAGFATIAGGYTFDATWTPQVIASWSWASGDQDPNDRDNERFDTLFGARRFEYGPTGIWGAVARANLNSPELRLNLQPSKTVDLMFAVRGVWLASERDAWTASGLRDRSGSSGTDVGTQYEARLRWDVLPKSFNLELGGAYLAEGSFQDRASANQGRDAAYGYVQCTWTF
ncbi:MAG: alginate export family protein [Planctomycetes bacterium]|nr:alginate export family protein [Planctomycetota bacterium]